MNNRGSCSQNRKPPPPPSTIRTPVQNHEGAGLISVVVAMALFAIMAGGLTNIFDMMNRAKNNVGNISALEQLKGGMQRVFDSPFLCTCNLSGLTFDTASLTTPTSIPQIQIYDQNCNIPVAPQVLATNGSPVENEPDLDITAMDLQDFVQVTSTTYTANIRIQVNQKAIESSFGAPQFDTLLPVAFGVQVDGGGIATVQACGHTDQLRETEIRLIYVNANRVIVAPNDTNNFVQVQLSDGSFKTLPLVAGGASWDWGTGLVDSVLGVSGEQASRWYYIYAIPHDTNENQGRLIVSQRPPITIGGPFQAGPVDTGLAAEPSPPYKYLGAFLNDATSSITRFYQSGNKIFFRVPIPIAAATGTGMIPFPTPPNEQIVTIGAITLPLPNANYIVPSTAWAGIYQMQLQRTGVSDPDGTQKVTMYISMDTMATNIESQYAEKLEAPLEGYTHVKSNVEVPFSNNNLKRFFFKVTAQTGVSADVQSYQINLQGYVDPYLDP